MTFTLSKSCQNGTSCYNNEKHFVLNWFKKNEIRNIQMCFEFWVYGPVYCSWLYGTPNWLFFWNFYHCGHANIGWLASGIGCDRYGVNMLNNCDYLTNNTREKNHRFLTFSLEVLKGVSRLHCFCKFVDQVFVWEHHS